MRARICAFAWILLFSGAVWPQAAQDDAQLKAVEVRFDIARYVVDGNTLLSADEVNRILAPFAGASRDFGDVQRALEALENAYRARGYGAVQVYLPEQELEKGEVRFRIVEARLRKIEVQGNKFFAEDNVRASLPSLVVGRTPNSNDVARNLGIVNENLAKQTNVRLRAGENEGDVDVLVEVADENPSKAFVTFDNTGTAQTGYYRLGLGYQHANLGGRDSALTLQYITSPDHLNDVKIYSAGYHIPLYSLGGSLDLIAAYSDVDNGRTATPAGPLTFTGRGVVASIRFNQHLERIAGYEHKVVWALDYRKYLNNCGVGDFGAAGCGTSAATFSVLPLSLSYVGSLTDAQSQTSGYVTGISNIPYSNDGDTAALEQARFGAKARYNVLRAGLSHTRSFAGDWQLRARLDAQYTNQVLVVPEQFGVGGMNSVRGFLERERSNDRGHSATIEVYTPDFRLNMANREWNLRLLGFYDFGRVSRVDPLPGEDVHAGMASAGAGLRMALSKAFSLRMDLANILNPEGTRQAGHWRGSVAGMISF